MIPWFVLIVVVYLVYLLSLGFSGAYASLMNDRRMDDTPILLLDRVAIIGASMYVAFVTVPEWLESHVRQVKGVTNRL